jgi:hypothetical protein
MPAMCLALERNVGDWSQVAALKFDKFVGPGQKVEQLDVPAVLVPDSLLSCQITDAANKAASLHW